jgi:hypothetical protein
MAYVCECECISSFFIDLISWISLIKLTVLCFDFSSDIMCDIGTVGRSVVKVLEVHVELLIVFQRRKKFLLLPLLISTFPFWTLMTWKEREKERKMERGWKWGRKMSAECKFWKKSENECLYSRHELLEKFVEMNLACLALNIFKFQLFSFCRRSYSKQW